MGFKGFVAFNAAVDQMKAVSDNLSAIREARAKKKETDELFSIKKQRAELDLKEAKSRGEMTSMQAKLMDSQMKEYLKQQNAINSGNEAMINMEEENQTQRMQAAGQVAQATFQEAQDFFAQTIGPGGQSIAGMAEREITPEAMPSIFESMPETVLQPSADLKGFKEGSKDEFALKRLNALKKAGISLTPDEEFFDYRKRIESQGMRYNKNDVLKTARQMAIDNTEKDKLGRPKQLNAQSIRDMLPEAEKTLYGESAPSFTPKKTPLYKSPPSTAQYNPNEDRTDKIQVKSPDGKLYMLPASQWNEARKQGFKRVN